jgi:mRNA interferase MazF
MRSLRTLRKHDLIVGRLPYTDAPYAKSRPLLVLAGGAHLKATEHIVALMITSARDSAWPGDYPLQAFDTHDLRPGSVVRLKFASVPAVFLRKHIGHLGPQDAAEVDRRVKDFLALA